MANRAIYLSISLALAISLSYSERENTQKNTVERTRGLGLTAGVGAGGVAHIEYFAARSHPPPLVGWLDWHSETSCIYLTQQAICASLSSADPRLL